MGGYITSTHAGEMPCMQIEFSRDEAFSNEEKYIELLNLMKYLKEYIQN